MMNQTRNELRKSLSSFRRVRRMSPTASGVAYHSHASRIARPTGALLISMFPTDNQQFATFMPPYRSFVSSTSIVHFAAAATPESPFEAGKPAQKKKGRRKFLPPKAAVELTPKARKFFKLLLEKPPRPDVIGVMLNYNQSTSGQPRMVFSFDFVTQDQIHEEDEGVSLELLEDGTPKPPKDSMDDGLPKLYVNHNGFMKVLGCTLDVDIEKMQPVLYDPAGNVKDPNIT